MKYSREKRLDIGREVYEKHIGIDEAALLYRVNKYTIRDYYREYKANAKADLENPKAKDAYSGYSREELIAEIMNLRVKLAISKGLTPVEAVHSLSDNFPISSLCNAAGITRAWYYKWLKGKQ